MTKWYGSKIGSAAACAVILGSPAVADVSAQQVWNDWKAFMTGFGYDVQSSESMSGDTLTVSDIAMTVVLPEDEGTVHLTFGELGFTNNDDGTVSVSMPESLPVTVTTDLDDAEDVVATLDYTSQGFVMTVGGDPDEMSYTYAADQLGVALTDLVVEGESVATGKTGISLSDVSGSTEVQAGELRQTTQMMSAGEANYDIDITDPEGDGRLVMEGSFDSMRFDGTGNFPSEMDFEQMPAMLEAGFGYDGDFSYEGGSSNFNFTEDDEQAQGSTRSAGGGLKVAMDSGGLVYDGAVNEMTLEMAGSDIPFPLELAIAELAFNMLLPVSSGDEDQDFALGLTIGDFTISEMIWGMFDPGGELPRDPATIAIDLSGKAQLAVDMFDPEQLESVEDGDAMPGELRSLNLNALTVRAAGTELTGDGAFTFDNSDLETFGGMPAPSGEVDLQLVGGNGLLDRLVGIGLLPEEQASGARMMMGLFAVPGDGEDTLTSKIEIREDGQILANGQRLQ